MALLILAYISGVLTVAAPCILPLLPIIIGGSVLDEDQKTSQKKWFRPVVITASLAVSVIIFSLLLKTTTTLLGVPQYVWSIISGTIVLLFGINLLFPVFWEKLMVATRLNLKFNQALNASYQQRGLKRDILLGASLGPVFSSCSPTYALIIAIVLPESFARGFLYLVAYALGLASVLLLIAIAGQSVTRKLGWLSNPFGLFRKVLGVLFIIVGVSVLFGWDKKFQTYVLQNGWYDPIMKFEQRLNLD